MRKRILEFMGNDTVLEYVQVATFFLVVLSAIGLLGLFGLVLFWGR